MGLSELEPGRSSLLPWQGRLGGGLRDDGVGEGGLCDMARLRFWKSE